MAFQIKKKKKGKAEDISKRLPATDAGTDSTSDVDSTDNSSDCGIVLPSVNPGTVATRSWVYRILGKFLKWTKFFATESLQVAGGVNAGRVETTELKTNDLYATSITLIGKDGRTGVLYIDDLGQLKVDYDFHDVFVYPGQDKSVSFKNFVYKYGMEEDRIAANFVGLTPIETMLNFTPFKSGAYKMFENKVCYKFCIADGKDEIVDKTMLVTCPSTKKIVGLDVLDERGNVVKELYRVSDGKTYRKMTINMPAFRANADGAVTKYVVLPGDCPSIGEDNLVPFVAPYLLPPKPPWFIPPAPPFMPPPPFPPAAGHDIFDDDPVPDDTLFDGDDTDGQFMVDNGYTVVWENYERETYFNVVLKKGSFDTNLEQYIRVLVESV